MTIVNINDIEDLIIAKYEIDTILNEQGKLEGRSNLQEFINKFANPQYIYLIDDLQIPFNYFKIENKDYLFVTNSDESEINIIKAKLKVLKYNLNNLVLLSKNDLSKMIDMNNVIIYDQKYYM